MNNDECEWDGGDCCQENPSSGWDNYCQTCECLDPSATDGCDGKVDSWWGDDYCDDFMNTEGCHCDGGDCCQDNPSAGWDNYCQVCECLDGSSPPAPNPPAPNPPAPNPPPTDGCDNKNDAWWGDDYCDDFMNTFGCDYDGGDCCQDNPSAGWDNYCQACECLALNTPSKKFNDFCLRRNVF